MNWEALLNAEAALGLHDRENLRARVLWINTLREIVSPRCPKNKAGAYLVNDIDVALASYEERLEAAQICARKLNIPLEE